LNVGTLIVRNGAASPATTLDSVDLLGRQSGEGGPTAWAVSNYMSNLSTSHHTEPQNSSEIEPSTSTAQAVMPEEPHQVEPRRNGSVRRRGLRARDSMSLASEYVAEIGSHSPYPHSAKHAYDASARTSETYLSVSSHRSSARSSQRSSDATSFESFAPPGDNSRGLEMHERFADAPTSIDYEAMSEKEVVPDTGMSSMDDISKRDTIQSPSGNTACKGRAESTSPAVKVGTDSGYSSGCSTHRVSQDTMPVVAQSNPTSRKQSITDSMSTDGAEGKSSATVPHHRQNATPSHKGRTMRKIERITGESLEYLNYPIIGNKTQKVILPKSSRSQLKLEKITGESLESLSYPVVGVVPHWQHNSRTRRRLEDRQSVESMGESDTSELVGGNSLKRSRSWKGSMRDSLPFMRSAPSSRSASPERDASELEVESSNRQRKKLQKRRPLSKDLSETNTQFIDNIPRVPTPVHSRFQQRLSFLPDNIVNQQALEDTSKFSSTRSSFNAENNDISTSFSEPKALVEHKTQANAPTRRPSFFRRGRKRASTPVDEDYELTGVVAVGAALGGTPYDIAMSADNRKSLERARSRSAGPKHPHHFADLSVPEHREEREIERVSKPMSAPKHECAGRTFPTPFVDRSRPPPEERCDTGGCSKRESVWNRELIAAANKGLPAELPASLIAGQPAPLSETIDPPVELLVANAVEQPTVLLPVVLAELPAGTAAEILEAPQPVDNVNHSLRQHSLWTSGRWSRSAFYPNHQISSDPSTNPPRSPTVNTRPSSSPATTISYASSARPAIILTSASPSPPPSPPQSPRRPKSAGHLSNAWKHRQVYSPDIEAESAEWSRRAQIWRENNDRAWAAAQKSKAISAQMLRENNDRAWATAQTPQVISAQKTPAVAPVVSPDSTKTAPSTREEVYASQGPLYAPVEGTAAIAEDVTVTPVLMPASGRGERYYAQLSMQTAIETPEAPSPAPTLSAEMGSGRFSRNRENYATTPQFSGKRETGTSRRNFAVLMKSARVVAI
jgi:hypothetical protein